MSIVTLEEAATECHIDETDPAIDLLQAFVDAVGPALEDYMKQVIVQRTIIEDLDLCGARVFRLTSTPVISLTSLEAIDGSITYDTEQMLVRSGGKVRVLNGPCPTGCVTATYEAGYETVPANFKRGALVVIQDAWEAQRGVGTVMPGIADEGDYRRTIDHLILRKARVFLGTPTTLAR